MGQRGPYTCVTPNGGQHTHCFKPSMDAHTVEAAQLSHMCAPWYCTTRARYLQKAALRVSPPLLILMDLSKILQ